MQLLQSMLRVKAWGATNALETYYREFRDQNGVRPTASEALHDGYNPRAARKGEGSWLNFVRYMGDLTEEQNAALQRLSAFLDALEVTPMTKSFKMLTLLAMLNRNQLPGAMHIDDLATEFHRLAHRSAPLARDAGPALDDRPALIELLETNPVAAWAGARGTQSRAYFRYAESLFATNFDVPDELRSALVDLVREIVDWRLAEYLLRPRNECDITSPIPCRVIQASGRPIIFFPDRRKFPHLPESQTSIRANGIAHRGNMAKLALNALHREDGAGPENALPGILVAWFGESAGQPGTQFRVELQQRDGTWELRPIESGSPVPGCELWNTYRRTEAAERFGFVFSNATWNQGYVVEQGHIFLFVTLNKDDLASTFQYQDRFLSPSRFQWQSQNRTTQEGKHGQLIKDHEAGGIPVHLFVRSTKKVRNESTPFTYCGDVSFESWTGDAPITIVWRLPAPVPTDLAARLGVPLLSTTS